ncbi:helix-turn-helix domain-containing protein [Amycolatopsis sp. NPDC051903]|uniref:helix-turn-helix domain-containing protein n=1 Tax=Amycolatopsis sp. NPDC051903 TaxID=3363936 RepID=UPI0037ABAE0A
MTEQRNTALGEFLRSRTHGLRREDVALLAGMSVTAYTRIERGENEHPSASMLDAIARALQLDDADQHLLLRLARPEAAERAEPEPEHVREPVRRLVARTTDQAVLVVGRRGDLLAANDLAHALFGFERGRPVNLVRQLFLDAAARDLVVDWEAQARRVSARLRDGACADPLLAGLVGELSIASRDFARIWAERPAPGPRHGPREFDHPLVGRLNLAEEAFDLPDEHGQQVLLFSAEPGSPAQERLALLASL